MVYVPVHDRIVLFGGFLGSLFSDETWAYDYNSDTWTIRAPGPSPSPRAGHAMAYDAASDRVILFGGFSGGALNDQTWAYDLGADAWTQMNPSTKPSPRERHRMTYVDPSDRIVLFGGSGGPRSDETWTYNFDADTWLTKNPATAPSGRHGHGMDYDAESDQVVLFSGDDGGQDTETWSYDLAGNAWTRRSDLNTPGGWVGHKLAYDSSFDRLLFFGGEWPFLSGAAGDETWVYDTNVDTWTSIPGLPSARDPAPRSYHTMAYDANADRIVLFGGWTDDSNDETWTYGSDANRWVETGPAAAPSARDSHAMAYDAQSQRVILFGGVRGFPGVLNAETWSFDVANKTWTNMGPMPAPSPRIGARMVYDEASDRIILFGGHNAGCHGDTWAYDLETNTWSNRAPTGSPTPRAWHTMAYDAESRRVVLFGGDPCTGGNPADDKDDTWTYDFANNSWVEMSPVDRPSKRAWSVATYDSESDRIVLFGGSSGRDETWAYDLNGDTWTVMNPTLVPSGRNAHAMVYAGQSDRIILFGGSWPPGLVTDPSITHNSETWAYDYGSDAWTPMRASPSKPTLLTALAGDGRITLEWSRPATTGSSPIAAYRIYRATEPPPFSLIATTGTLSFLDVNVSNGATYRYHVTAVNGEGESLASDAVEATPEDTTAPTLVISSPRNGSTLNDTTVTVAGTAFDSGTVIRVEIGTDGVNWDLAAGTESWSGTLVLAEGQNTIFARATDGFNNKAEENITVSVETVPEPPPPRPIPWWEDPLILGILAAVGVGVIAVSLILLRRRGRP